MKICTLKSLIVCLSIFCFMLKANAQEVHDVRFFPTKLYLKGGHEVKLFNNYYREKFQSDFQQDFFASFFQVLIGTDRNINWGIDLKYRSAAIADSPEKFLIGFPLSNVSFSEGNSGLNFRRAGLSAIGPRIKYSVESKLGSISILHAVYFPTLPDGEGNQDFGFADWESLQFYNNVFFERNIDDRSNIFFDLGFHFENLGGYLWNEENGYGQLLLPITAIYNFYPNYKSTLYGMLNLSPRIGFSDGGNKVDIIGGAFSQIGLGAKYFITPKFEAELLYTQFFNFGANSSASTFNLGFRYFRN